MVTDHIRVHELSIRLILALMPKFHSRILHFFKGNNRSAEHDDFHE